MKIILACSEMSGEREIITHKNVTPSPVFRIEEGLINVMSIRRLSGIGLQAERMNLRSNQFGDIVNLSTHIPWSPFQMGLKFAERC